MRTVQGAHRIKYNRVSRYINALPRFQKLLIKAANANIPRGFRKTYLLGWSAESEKLYKKYTVNQTVKIGKKLLPSLNKTRRQKLITTLEQLNMKKSSHEAWTLLK